MYQSRLRHCSWLQRMEQKYKVVVETENKKRHIWGIWKEETEWLQGIKKHGGLKFLAWEADETTVPRKQEAGTSQWETEVLSPRWQTDTSEDLSDKLTSRLSAHTWVGSGGKTFRLLRPMHTTVLWATTVYSTVPAVQRKRRAFTQEN